mgnify:CR=1 FL=1
MNYELNNGLEIPSIAFGTWKFPDNDGTSQIISNAIECGYRYIDTAKSYGNESSVGKGIKNANIKREDIIIGGKLWNDDRGYDNIIKACYKTIETLACDYLDIYLVHWPASKAVHENWQEINEETWKAMEYLYNSGIVKAIGVCNFKVNQLEALLKNAKIKPMINQIECHPGFMQEDIIEFCKQQKILVEAWSPLGSGKLLKKEQLREIASKYNKDVAQTCIKWCLQNGVLPLPKTSNMERMKSNLNVFDFEISKDDMDYLNNLPYMAASRLDSEIITIFN